MRIAGAQFQRTCWRREKRLHVGRPVTPEHERLWAREDSVTLTRLDATFARIDENLKLATANQRDAGPQ